VKLLVQIDRKKILVDQMWDLQAKFKAQTEAVEELTPLVKAGNRLAQLAAQYGVPEAVLIAVFSVSFTEVLLGR